MNLRSLACSQFAVAALFLTATLLDAQPLPPGGAELVDPNAKLQMFADNGGQALMMPVNGQKFFEAPDITVAVATPDKPWSAYVTAPIAGNAIKAGDRLVVTYLARCTRGAPAPPGMDGPMGLATAKIQLSGATHDMLGITDATKFGNKWQTVARTIVAKMDAPAAATEVTIFLGEQKQSVEIADIHVLNYGGDYDLAKLPHEPRTYEGREPDAAWRKEALERIEKNRMTDYSVIVVGRDGKPLANATIGVDLVRSEFGFGSCVTRQLLTEQTPDAEKYRDIAARTFSRVVFENDLKPGLFPEDSQGLEQLTKTVAWLKEQGISIRGHYLMQNAIDGWTRERLGDPAKLRSDLMESVRTRIGMMKHDVIEWDVINHPVAWEGAELLTQRGPPFDTLPLDVFREARNLTDLPLCVNEDQIFRPGRQQDKTFDYLTEMKRQGLVVAGLGNQAHMHSSFLPSPMDMLKVTDRFATVVPKQVITEYDIVAEGDDQLAADYLRDSMIACFSHPAYDGFLLWGFWEGSHWLPEAALWKKSWQPKPAALVWEDWVGKRWHTTKGVKSDAAGKITWRGFKGTYRLWVQIPEYNHWDKPFQPGSPAEPLRIVIR